MPKYGYEYEMEYVTSYNATLAEPEVIGPVAEGLRLNHHFRELCHRRTQPARYRHFSGDAGRFSTV